MYARGQVSGGRRDIRISEGWSGRRTRRAGLSRQEQARLLQLLACLVLFLAVYIGKGVFPAKMVQVRADVLSMISSDTDFRSAFSRLGESLTGEGDLLGELGDFCVAVFGAGENAPETLAPQPVPELTNLLRDEQEFLSGEPDCQTLIDHYLPDEEAGLSAAKLPGQKDVAPQETQNPPTEAASGPAPQAVAALGTVLLKSAYNGQPLPEGYTMDELSLGGLDTVTPVLGHINSTYGYREHPIDGRHQFHGGLDIGGQTGDPIRAFAAGTVEYIGQDDSYGLYFQLDHGNGVKSFYAHCKSVCVQKGQTVAAGEKVGEVGSSGSATGPHLHLELKYNGTHLDPAYYVDYLTDQ